MHLSSRTWSIISVVLLAAAALFLWLDWRETRRGQPQVMPATGAPSTGASSSLRTVPANGPVTFDLLSARGGAAVGAAPSLGVVAAPAIARGLDRDHGYRLANSLENLDTLAARDTSILLENAFLDAPGRVAFEVPPHLQAEGEPMGWLVQLDRPLDAAFYAELKAVGAEFVAYVPHHTALVRASAVTARRLEAGSGVRQVLPYEPAFKLSRQLLPLAVEQEPLPPDTLLKVLLYPGQTPSALPELERLGVQRLAENRSPFGPVLTARVPSDALAAVARLAVVQRIEVAAPRAVLNDLSRVRVGVSPDTVTNLPHLGLTGTNLLVSLNDTGVDATHPALQGRVTTTDPDPRVLEDAEGHGTHVAGTLAGNGAESLSATNVQGSLTNALYSGMAPGARLFVLPIDLFAGPLVSDAYLQEQAAEAYYGEGKGTNVLISNNSWSYFFAADYDLAAASYDEATRDALPRRPGAQPILFVFAAGNDGDPSGEGTSRAAGSIVSPATAKNVITVGAVEQLRLITNLYFVTNLVKGTTNTDVMTNQPFLQFTDSRDEVASFSSCGNVGIGREGDSGRFKPDVVAPGTFVVSARSAAWDWERYIDPTSPEYPLVSNLVNDCGPRYRYETGTSQSAPVVSGILVLMQEYFETQLKRSSPPALLKALLINGARSVSSDYDLQVRKKLNVQGWGLPNLTNSLPATLSNVTAQMEPPRHFFADPVTNILASGRSHTWKLTLNTNENNEARFVPLRVTLAWTDPPGNPGAAIKLVNDLDLLVTNLDSGEVYVGNHFLIGKDFTAARDTNNVPVPDSVNNVENVFIEPVLGTNYTISVVARRVNVNTVTANLTDVVQDYALVISAGEGVVTNPVERLEWVTDQIERLPVRTLTNGVAETKQRAGAHFQLFPNPNGVTNQWAFYVFTNIFYTNQNVSGLTNGSNVAFITFLPPNLARPRNVDSDIDLFVSKDVRLLDLDPAAIAGADQSLKRGGTELIFYTNALIGDVFYVGVKAEDQQASEFGLIVQSSDLPFSDTDEFGNLRLYARGTPVVIPDGSPDQPGGVLLFAISQVAPLDVLRVYAELGLSHESVGDLQCILSHQGDFVVLHNHNRFFDSTNLVWNLTYDDTRSGLFPGSQPSDGPGSLNNFIGQTSGDVWLLAATDDAAGRTGTVDRLVLRVTPMPLWTDEGIRGYVPPNEWAYYFIEVPIGASSLTVIVDDLNPQLPLDLYLRRGQLPTFDEYDKRARLPGTGGALTLTRFDSPPLNPGRYFIGLYNPNPVGVSFRVRTFLEFDLNAVNRGGSVSTDTPRPVQDDAITRSTISVNESRPVIDVAVGVRVEHPRASDLVFHLISPQGTRVLLAENRGGTSPDGYGATLLGTNLASVSYSGGPAEFRTNLSAGTVEGQLNVEYEFYSVPDTLRVYYEGRLLFDTGLVSYDGQFSVRFGPGISTNVVIVVNEGGNSVSSTVWDYSASLIFRKDVYTIFTEQTNLASQLIKFASPPFTNSPLTVYNTNRLVFEDGFETYGSNRYAGGLTLGQWQVGPGDVIVHGTPNPLGVAAAGGSNLVEFVVGTEPSGLATEIGTVDGYLYRTVFQVARNPLTPAGTPQTVGLFVEGVLVRQVNPTGLAWQTVEVVWRAEHVRSGIEFRTTSPAGPLLDEVRVYEVIDEGQAYFLPEENMLKPLAADSAFGDWTLEIRDDRVGSGAPEPPRLISWILNFVFANTNPPATLLRSCTADSTTVGVYTNGCQLATNVVSGDEIKYFIVEVPLSASQATNVVASLPGVTGGSGDLVVLHNGNGLPSGTLPGDVIIDSPSTSGEFFVLSTNAPPELVPGQRYYLGVANRNPAEVNAFTISVTFDRTDAVLLVVPPLTNSLGSPISTNNPGTNLVQYFRMSAPATGSNYAVVQLQPQGADLDLYLRKARAIPDPLPRPTFGQYDYASTNSGTNLEEIILTEDSVFEPLEPAGLGTNWYVGVHNPGTTNVPYTLGADLFPLQTLASGVTWTNPFAASAFGPFLHYYRFVVVGNGTNLEANLEVNVTLPASAGNGMLYVRRLVAGAQPLPRTSLFDAAYALTGGTVNQVQLDSLSPPFLEPGIWYFGLDVGTNSPNPYAIQIVERRAVPDVIPLLDGQPVTLTVSSNAPVQTYFRFSIAQADAKVLFEVYDLSQDGELLLEPEAFPQAGTAFRTALGAPTQSAQIVLRTNTGAPPDLRGDWYLWVRPQSPGDLTFTIRAALPVNGVLESGLPLSFRIVPGGPGLHFSWNSVDGERYAIESSTNLVSWALLTHVIASGTSGVWADPDPPSQPMLFYRVRPVP